MVLSVPVLECAAVSLVARLASVVGGGVAGNCVACHLTGSPGITWYLQAIKDFTLLITLYLNTRPSTETYNLEVK